MLHFGNMFLLHLNNICQNFTNSYVPNLSKSNSDSIFDSIRANVDAYSNELSSFNIAFDQNNIQIDKKTIVTD